MDVAWSHPMRGWFPIDNLFGLSRSRRTRHGISTRPLTGSLVHGTRRLRNTDMDQTLQLGGSAHPSEIRSASFSHLSRPGAA